MFSDMVPGIFLSFRHTLPTTLIARERYAARVPASEAWAAELFMDEQGIEPADLFDAGILGTLERCEAGVLRRWQARQAPPDRGVGAGGSHRAHASWKAWWEVAS